MPDLYVNRETGEIYDDSREGIDYLADLVVANILNSVLSDLYSPDFGTEFKFLPRQNIISKTEIEMQIQLGIKSVEQRMIQEQNETPSTADEMLESIKIISLEENIDKETNRKYWDLLLKVTSIDGQSKEIRQSI